MKLGKAVNISATASNATVIVDPPAITPGKVAEVIVIPDDINGNGDEPPDPPHLEILEEEPIIDDEPIIPGDGDETETITITIMGERKWFNTTQTVTLEVREGEDHLASIASEMRDRFIPWLAENYPELGIDEETEWIGTIVRPRILVVMYYLFFSEEWEMGVRWHVMIPPYDWAEIYLRNRRTEISPSLAFKIPSLDAQDEPEVVDPPESVWR